MPSLSWHNRSRPLRLHRLYESEEAAYTVSLRAAFFVFDDPHGGWVHVPWIPLTIRHLEEYPSYG